MYKYCHLVFEYATAVVKKSCREKVMRWKKQPVGSVGAKTGTVGKDGQGQSDNRATMTEERKHRRV